MALTENKRVQLIRPDLAVKRTVPADAGTYYIGQIVLAGPASNTVKPISGSTEVSAQVAGIVLTEQTVAAGEKLDFFANAYVVGFDGVASGSGFTNSEVNKLAWSADGATVYDAQSGATNAHIVGRFQGFTTQANGQSCSTFLIATPSALSGSTV